MNNPIAQFIALIAIVVVVAFILVSNPKQGANVTTMQSASGPTATITTPKGDIVFELFSSDAPKTVENFVGLAKRNYYNGLKFHRVEPGFVIQGGDPKGDGTGGESIYGPTFADELNSDTPSFKNGYKKGVVAMANSGPNTNGSQFFIMLKDTDLPHKYTIFGQVKAGLDVIDAIAIGDTMTTITIQEDVKP